MNVRVEQELQPAQLQELRPASLLVRVRSITYLAEDINAYELVDLDGGDLPPFSAGSHIDLYFRDGRIRQYSLCNNPSDRKRYVFAVQREKNGRGGSVAIFDRIHVGRVLSISQPRNNFPLVNADNYLFLAGGIGITPIFSMISSLEQKNANFKLHYCTRNLEKTAFASDLEKSIQAGNASLHHDGGIPSAGLDIRKLLKDVPEGAQLYFCGPPGFMNAVREAADHWPKDSIHFEYFSNPESPSVATPPGGQDTDIAVGFQVKIASSGQILDVPNDKSIAQVLRENNVEIETSCEAGVCGTCKVNFLSGTPDHRDLVLRDEEKEHSLLVCCSRSKSQLLVLDL